MYTDVLYFVQIVKLIVYLFYITSHESVKLCELYKSIVYILCNYTGPVEAIFSVLKSLKRVCKEEKLAVSGQQWQCAVGSSG